MIFNMRLHLLKLLMQHLAASKGFEPVVLYLIREGADVNAIGNVSNLPCLLHELFVLSVLAIFLVMEGLLFNG